MLSVLVTNPKGGCGKTTLATNLAAAFAHTGFATVLADCDRQKSSFSWAYRRPPKAPAVEVVDWTKKIGKLPKGTQRLVIDAPAAIRRKEVRELVRTADVLVVPVQPSLFDEATTRGFLRVLDKLKPIRNNKRVLALVGNRVRSRTRAARELDAFLEAVGHEAVTRIRDSQTYPTAAAAGLSVFDMGSRRIESFVADWQPLLRLLGRVALERGA